MPRVVALVIALLVLSSFSGGARVGATTAQGSTPAASAVGCPTTGEAENEALARRWFEGALNGRELDVLDEILVADFVHNTANPLNANGRAGARRLLTGLLTGFPDARYTVDAAIVDGDRVVLRWTTAGTHEGDFGGFAPTGRRATWTGINVFRVRCGLITESWAQTDGLGRLRQLGLLPGADAVASPVAATTGGGGHRTPPAARPRTTRRTRPWPGAGGTRDGAAAIWTSSTRSWRPITSTIGRSGRTRPGSRRSRAVSGSGGWRSPTCG